MAAWPVITNLEQELAMDRMKDAVGEMNRRQRSCVRLEISRMSETTNEPPGRCRPRAPLPALFIVG